MKILFLTLVNLEQLGSHSIYGDLLKTFVSHGHEVYAVCPRERRSGLPTELLESCGVHVLAVATGNIQKTSVIEKGLATAAIMGQFRGAINKYLSDVQFDLLLYSTPPVTLAKLIASLKRRNEIPTYLLLKDIFPQNAIDLGMLRDSGLVRPIYRHFKHDEEVLYRSSDNIGCMSEANCTYLLAQNPWLSPDHVEVNPNSLIPEPFPETARDLFSTQRQALDLPIDEKVFVYGGNLGKPQAIDFLIRTLELNEQEPVGFFAIAGDGTERPSLTSWFEKTHPKHAKLYGFLQREQYDHLTACCNAGLVLLDHRFTIPNYPSRILSYMQVGIPLICATDTATDVGKMAVENGYGVTCDSIDEHHLIDICRELSLGEMTRMGECGRRFFNERFTSEVSYHTIMRHFETEHS